MPLKTFTDIHEYIKQIPAKHLFSEAQVGEIVSALPEFNAIEKDLIYHALAQCLECDALTCEMILAATNPKISPYQQISKLEQAVNERINILMERSFFKHFPIEKFNLTRKEWQFLQNKMQQFNVQHLTFPFVEQTLANLRGRYTYERIVESLVRKQPTRACRKRASPPQKSFEKRPRMSYRHAYGDENLIIAQNTTPRTKKIARKRGIKERPLVMATPPRENHSYQIWKTPENNTHYRKLLGVNGKPKVLKKETPLKQQATRKIFPAESKPGKVEEYIFTVTVADVCKDTNLKRKYSQNTLMRGSCREKFVEQDFEINVNDKNGYHWYHIIGLCLGGEHCAENIKPTTREANLNTLDMIERPILKLLKENPELKIHIKMRIFYEADCEIPSILQCDLSWKIPHINQNTGEYTETPHEEQILLNLRTKQRLSRTMRAIIDDYHTYNDEKNTGVDETGPKALKF